MIVSAIIKSLPPSLKSFLDSWRGLTKGAQNLEYIYEKLQEYVNVAMEDQAKTALLTAFPRQPNNYRGQAVARQRYALQHSYNRGPPRQSFRPQYPA